MPGPIGGLERYEFSCEREQQRLFMATGEVDWLLQR